ncbi:MAG: hypothetical protein H7062_13285, partial [Candidatus Saccharimonas sp.]|nr:hypothetical protein [Planctomycetaceae bacterium]
PPEVARPGIVLGAQRHDRTWRLLVRDLDDAGRIALEADPNHASVDVRRLSLEEIFVACMTTKAEGFGPSVAPATNRVSRVP